KALGRRPSCVPRVSAGSKRATVGAMSETLSTAMFALALILYAGASVLFYLDVARSTRREAGAPASTRAPRSARMPPSARAPELAADSKLRPDAVAGGTKPKTPPGPRTDLAPVLLGLGAVGHAGYVVMASFVAHVCPIHSVHFIFSVASLFAIAAYLT